MHLTPDKKAIEISVPPRVGSAAVCSGCHKPAPGYDRPDCGVVVEEVPWGDGKHQLTRAYMLFLARWARRLSWTETARLSHLVEKVCDAVEYVVTWGLEHRACGRHGCCNHE